MLALVWAAFGPTPALSQSVVARLERRTLSIGESTTLVVTVRGLQVSEDPQFDLPPGLELLGSGQARNFSWVNGRMSAEIVFRYEIGANEAGHQAIGPITVHAGQQAYSSGILTLEVSAAPQHVGGSGRGPAALQVEVVPSSPYVGQPTTLRVRLIQRAAFAEDPQYIPPVTTGFWADRPSPPESFYADQGGEQVLVTETRTRLYPLAAGESIIGGAAASVVIAEGQSASDPIAWLRGGRRRTLTVRSRPVAVRVRALPSGAPASFSGAVGQFAVAWGADRSRTSQDVPLTVRLEVRGAGNLPLIRAPALDDREVEVFASTVEDSLGEPTGIGRKRFQWTVLPRRPGSIQLAAPEFSWFDPASGSFQIAQPPALPVEVGPALFQGAASASPFPAVFTGHPVDPGARAPEPWVFTFAGLVLGTAAALWKASRRRPESVAVRAQQLEWLRAVGMAKGPDFWHAADQGLGWLETRAGAVREGQAPAAPDRRLVALRAQVAVARYGRGAGDANAVRRELVERLSKALPPPHPRLALRAASVMLAVAALAWCVVLGPRAGDERGRARGRAADRLARAGDVPHARAAWLALWNEGGRDPGLAARIAWAYTQSGSLGPGALWVLRGNLAGPRDASLTWVTERVREGGGLVGASLPRLPITPWEWSAAALVLGFAAAWAWPRRRVAVLGVVLTSVAGMAYPLQGWLAERSERAVVLRAVGLEGSDIELQAGQVVTIQGRRAGQVQVRAGQVAEGWLPREAVEPLGAERQ
jgi:hypothetical protein